MSKKQLYLLTDTFPYGKGEKTFIIPELKELRKHFEVTIISAASMRDKNNTEMTSEISSDIRVIHYPMGNVEKWEVLGYIIPFLSYKGTYKELKFILKGKEDILYKLKKSLYYFASADKFKNWMDKNHIIRQGENSICYSYWYNYRVLGMVMDKKKYPKMKILTRAHGYDLYNERIEVSGRQSYKEVMDGKIDNVVFISKHGYDYYLNYFANSKMENKKYFINRLGVDRQRAILRAKEREMFLLVSCANLVQVKRIELIIFALGELEDICIHWVHFGTGEEHERILKLADRYLASKKNITYEFKGHVNNDLILNYYKSEVPDCFIMTSYSEGSPVAMQEALACGIPVIGTNVGGIPEMINGNGILLSMTPSVKEIADAIRKLYYSNVDVRNEMRNRSYQIWKAYFDRKKNIQEFIAFLKDLN